MNHKRMFAKALLCVVPLVAASVAEASECKPLPAASAPIEQDVKLAQQHFDTAVQAFADQRYEVAKVEFSAAYALSRRPGLLYNLSLTCEKQGQFAEAIEYAARHLCEQGNDIPQSEVDEARGRLARLRQALADQEAKTKLTTPDPIPRRPLPPELAYGAERSPGAHVRTPAGALALIGTGAGLLAIGIGCGVGAITTSQAFDGTPRTMGEINDLTARGQALNAAAIALDVTGGLALGAGVVWLAWQRKHRSPPVLAQAGLLLVH